MENFFDRDINIVKINLVMTVPAGSGSAKHRNRKYHGVVLYLGGEMKYDFADGQTLKVGKSVISYLPQYSDYDVSVIIPGDCIAINFFISESGVFDPFSITLKPIEYITAASLFQSADRIWNSKRNGYMMKLNSILYDILYLTYNCVNAEYITQKAADRLSKSVEYIENNYYKKTIRISELAEMSGMSVEYYRRQFRAVHRVPPLKYINGLRINRSMELLDAGMYIIKEIALLCGYEDESYFSREFKNFTGYTPREYKSRNQLI